MPASLKTEEKVLNLLLKKEAFTATVAYIGLSTFKKTELLKKTTAKEFGEKEPTEANGWKRIQVDTIEWEVTKAEAETGKTIYKNKNAITFEKLSGGEYKLETFAILPKAKQTEDGTEPFYVGGVLTEPFPTINSATSSFTIPAKELLIECE